MRTYLNHRNRRAFTLGELLVAVAILAMLAALSLGSLTVAQERARRTVCLNNIRQVGIGMMMYASASNDRLPPYFYVAEHGHGNGEHYKIFVKPKWAVADLGFIKNLEVLVCPSDKTPSQINTTDSSNNPISVICSYGYNFELFMLGLSTDVVLSSRTVLVFDGRAEAAQQGVWRADEWQGSGYPFVMSAPGGNGNGGGNNGGNGGNGGSGGNGGNGGGSGGSENSADLDKFNSQMVARRHSGKMVVFFLDGHCEVLTNLPANSLLSR